MTQQNGAVFRRSWRDGLTGYHYLVLVVASCGWLFDTMDQWLYVLARQPAIADLLDVPLDDPAVKHYSGIVQTLFIIGWATGGFLFGMLGDRFGRTRTMALTVLMYAGFTGLSGLSQNWWQFAAFRFLTGLGVGGEFAAGASLVAEVFPDHARATALGIMQASSAIGNILAGVINLTVAPTWGWRSVFFVGVLPAFLVFVIRLYVREPERWEDAKKKATGSHMSVGSILELFSPAYRRGTLVGLGMAAIGIIGFWGISTWSPDLLRGVLNPTNDPALRAATERSVSLAAMAQNFGAFWGALAFAFIAQRIGRLPTFALTFLGCLYIIPATFFLTKSFALALYFFPLMGFFLLMLLGGFAVYFPELYPTRLRATGVGFCYNTARYLAAAAPMVFGHLSAVSGIAAAATILSSAFLFGLFILPVAEETKDKPLPE